MEEEALWEEMETAPEALMWLGIQVADIVLHVVADDLIALKKEMFVLCSIGRKSGIEEDSQ